MQEFGVWLLLVGNLGWYLPKLYLRSQGRLDSWFDHWGDFRRLRELAVAEPSQVTRVRLCQTLLWLCAATAILGAALFAYSVLGPRGAATPP